MKSLDQIRGQQALLFWNNHANDANVHGQQGGDVLSGLPALIINNGLLATIAFAIQKEGGHETLMREVGRYLSQGRGILSQPAKDLRSFARQLCEGSSALLQRATDEALEYIQFLKRLQP